MTPTRIDISVPATSANLGPGFDTLGLALGLRLKAEFLVGGDGYAVKSRGNGSETLPVDRSNLILRAAQAAFAKMKRPLPPMRVVVDLDIPLARGLGSSAAAALAGVLAANAIAGEILTPDEVVQIAAKVEGHPDNVGPAMFGGVTIAVSGRAGGVRCVKVPVSRQPGLVLAVPESQLATSKARAALPFSVPYSDVSANLSAVAVLTLALSSGNLELLPLALQDKLHEPYRRRLVPGMPSAISAAMAAGAWGVTLSGAGPSLLAWCPPEAISEVKAAIEDSWTASGIPGGVRPVEISDEGARVERSPRPFQQTPQ